MVQPQYNNACFGITAEEAPDPFVLFAHGKFYMTFTGRDRIPMWEADSLLDFREKPCVGAVWYPVPGTKYSEHLWAPELHALSGRWYIYFAAADPRLGNKSHRMYVLGGPSSDGDPHAGSWELLGSIKGMDQRQWAIDGTVFELDRQLYFVYSGWPLDRPWVNHSEDDQELYIVRMADPVTAISAPTRICRAEHAWEKHFIKRICEGPQWLASPDGKWKGLVYSCGASWTPDYKMATLQYLGGDPLLEASWRKSPSPLVQNADHGQGPFGPGHGSFVHIGNETVALFHATDKRTDGNLGRKCRMQRVLWTEQGPYMGDVVGLSTRDPGVFLGGDQTGSLDRDFVVQQGDTHRSQLSLALKGS